MSYVISSSQDHVTTITLNRPEKLNAFGGTMREELHEAVRSAAADEATRVVVITGAGRGFCAGGDVDFMARLQADRDEPAFRKLLDAGRDVVTAIVNMEKPVIAAVNGVAAGAGCNLALACDFRIASDAAKIGATFVRIGVHPDWGGTWLLPRVVGRSRALELMMTGRIVDAAEALDLGLFDQVVAADRFGEEVTRLATALAAGPPIAIAGIKRAVNASERHDLERQLELETSNQMQAFRSADSAEGMRAFFEKRPARFRGE